MRCISKTLEVIKILDSFMLPVSNREYDEVCLHIYKDSALQEYFALTQLASANQLVKMKFVSWGLLAATTAQAHCMLPQSFTIFLD